MHIVHIARKNLIHHFSSSFLSVLLTSFGTAIFCLILLLSNQFNRQLTINSRHIDLVVGAKGSPLQLILNSIYHIDYPTGNILLKDAEHIAKHPLVRLAVPLSMGDNYQGYRIIGTDSTFLSLYGASLGEGRWVNKDFEAVIGYQVAHTKKLRLGDRITGAHGLSNAADLHTDHPYTVSGILNKSENVVDRLVLTNLSSVWHMHEEHPHDGEELGQNEVKSLVDVVHQDKEITSLLIQYKNPTAVALFPRMVNQTTNMQAASPAMESARLLSMMGIGMDTLTIFASVLMCMAAISVFISLYNAFTYRKYELALMRTMGASRIKLFLLMVTEGLYITLLGTVLGMLLAHVSLWFIDFYGSSEIIRPWQLQLEEIRVIWIGLAIGIIASLIPAIKAYTTSISKTLSR